MVDKWPGEVEGGERKDQGALDGGASDCLIF